MLRTLINRGIVNGKLSSNLILKNNLSTLVVIEQKAGKVATESLSAISAAQKLGNGEIVCVVSGQDSKAASDVISQIKGVNKVLLSEDANLQNTVAETLADYLVKLQKDNKFTHIVGPNTAFGKNTLPRVAALLDVAQISDISGVVDENTFVRPIYAGNAIAKVKSNDAVKVITVRGTAFAQPENSSDKATIEAAPSAQKSELAQWVSEEIIKSDRPELSSANKVISGGRGLKSGDNFKLLYDLADKLGAAVGASRAAVDAGYVDNSLQVGQTGKIVAPELYIAVGISGAIQHLAGMKDSKVIVAINKDPEAPIFQVADYGLVGDLFKVVPELTEKL